MEAKCKLSELSFLIGFSPVFLLFTFCFFVIVCFYFNIILPCCRTVLVDTAVFFSGNALRRSGEKTAASSKQPKARGAFTKQVHWLMAKQPFQRQQCQFRIFLFPRRNFGN